MGSRVRIRLFHILHFARDLLFSLLKNFKSGVDDRGQSLRSVSPLTNYPHALAAVRQWPTSKSPFKRAQGQLNSVHP